MVPEDRRSAGFDSPIRSFFKVTFTVLEIFFWPEIGNRTSVFGNLLTTFYRILLKRLGSCDLLAFCFLAISILAKG